MVKEIRHNPLLRRFLEVDYEDGPLMNESFLKYKDNIERNLYVRGAKPYDDEDKILLDKCLEHSKEFDQGIEDVENKGLVVLVHPFYLQLSNMNFLKNVKVQDQSIEYVEKLRNFLGRIRYESQRRVLLFETVHHYAAASSLLLEDGLVNSVLFTEFDTGDLLNPKELEPFKDKKFFVAGGYDGLCLLSSMGELEKITSKNNIYGISDLVLDYPNEEDLSVKRVYGLPLANNLSLEETLERIGVLSNDKLLFDKL